MEKHYEDIYRDEPYFEVEYDNNRALLFMLYVPPHLRHQGHGKALFSKLIAELPSDVEYIRLISASLGSGCTLDFWRSLGFKPAYSNCDPAEEGRILHLGVNGFETPRAELLSQGDCRHWVFD